MKMKIPNTTKAQNPMKILLLYVKAYKAIPQYIPYSMKSPFKASSGTFDLEHYSDTIEQ